MIKRLSGSNDWWFSKGINSDDTSLSGIKKFRISNGSSNYWPRYGISYLKVDRRKFQYTFKMMK